MATSPSRPLAGIVFPLPMRRTAVFAFVLSAWTPPPFAVMGVLVALGLYKFALLAIAP